MNETLFECRVKATSKEGDRLRWSINWMFARRAKLVLTTSELICGDWIIPYVDFEDAIVATVPTRFGPARHFLVKWRGEIYQFQLKTQSLLWVVMNPFWDGPLPFPVRREVRYIQQWRTASRPRPAGPHRP